MLSCVIAVLRHVISPLFQQHTHAPPSPPYPLWQMRWVDELDFGKNLCRIALSLSPRVVCVYAEGVSSSTTMGRKKKQTQRPPPPPPHSST